jgi:chemotaxis protein CheC
MQGGPDDARRRTLSRLLTTIFERAAESASQALSVWLGRAVRMTVSEVAETGLAEAAELLGPGDALVAACVLRISGRLSGELLLAFDDAAGLALADLLLRQPPGTAKSWGELERSAADETANIVGCALLNSLAAHLSFPDDPAGAPLVPSPPEFRHEFAASLLEFSLMEQAMQSDLVMLARSRFEAEGLELGWSLVFVPGADALRVLESALS